MDNSEWNRRKTELGNFGGRVFWVSLVVCFPLGFWYPIVWAIPVMIFILLYFYALSITSDSRWDGKF